MAEESRRTRLSIDVDADLRRRIKIAAAEKDMSFRDLVVSILSEALAAAEETDRRAWTSLSAASFARDWSSDADAIYDAIR